MDFLSSNLQKPEVTQATYKKDEEEEGGIGGIEIFVMILLSFALFASAGVVVYLFWGSNEKDMKKSDVDEPRGMMDSGYIIR